MDDQESRNNKITAVSLGFDGLAEAETALDKAKSAPELEKKVEHLTYAVELLLAGLQHAADEREREELNASIGNAGF